MAAEKLHQLSTPAPSESAADEYVPPVEAVPGAKERGQQAEKDDLAKPRFTGWVNGIYLYNIKPPDDPKIGSFCDNAELRYMPDDDVRSSKYFFPLPRYFPTQMRERESPRGVQCHSDEVLIHRDVSSIKYGIDVGMTIYVDQHGFHAETSEDRVKAITVGGKKAVGVLPLTPEGFGESAIAIAEDSGTFLIGTFNLPFDELLKIAESTQN